MRFEEYADRDIETQDTETIREKTVLPQLKHQIKYISSNSPFYKKKLKGLKLTDFESLPFTEKKEIIADQNKQPPFGSNLCVEIQDIQRVHRTAGSTGRPVFLAMTKADLKTVIISGRRCFWASGLRPDDLVVHCLNYCLWAGGYTDHHSLEATGAGVIPYGVGNSHGLIDAILYLKPTAIHCTPSYLAKLEIVLEDEFKLTPRDLHLKKGFFGGEGGLQNPNYRKQLEDKWGIIAMNANYGLSEVHSMFGAECRERNGLHFMAQEFLLAELIDTKNEGPIEIKKGNVGELVLTHLQRQSQPLIRFRTHDSIEIIDHRPCKCGRTSFKFKVVGRSDDMLIIKGINVYPDAIKDVLMEFSQFTGEYKIIVGKTEPVDKISLRIELEKGEHNSKLKISIARRLKESLSINPTIEILGKGDLSRTDGKTKRVVKE
jgi:phenylacetate-CoA ligase